MTEHTVKVLLSALHATHKNLDSDVSFFASTSRQADVDYRRAFCHPSLLLVGGGVFGRLDSCLNWIEAIDIFIFSFHIYFPIYTYTLVFSVHLFVLAYDLHVLVLPDQIVQLNPKGLAL